MIDPSFALVLTCFLLGLWGVHGAAQWIAVRGDWRNGLALGWDLQRLQRRSALLGAVQDRLYSNSGWMVLVAVQLLASIMLLLSVSMAALIAFLLVVTLIALRVGANGADKMAMVCAGGALLQAAGARFGSPELIFAGILWVGGQLTIAYFASGLSKALLAPWRSGDALSAVLSSRTWGHPWFARLPSHPRIARAGAWLIIMAELLFPLALFLPPVWLAATLAAFLLFHIAIAVVMGLNTYPIAFLASYPSVILLGNHLRAAI